MAELHHLPLAGLGGTGIWRLTRELAASFGAGDELGSRILHIRASARALEELGDQLEAKIADLAGLENVSGLAMPAAIAALQHLAKECRALSRVASTFPPTGLLDPTVSPNPQV